MADSDSHPGAAARALGFFTYISYFERTSQLSRCLVRHTSPRFLPSLPQQGRWVFAWHPSSQRRRPVVSGEGEQSLRSQLISSPTRSPGGTSLWIGVISVAAYSNENPIRPWVHHAVLGVLSTELSRLATCQAGRRVLGATWVDACFVDDVHHALLGVPSAEFHRTSAACCDHKVATPPLLVDDVHHAFLGVQGRTPPS